MIHPDPVSSRASFGVAERPGASPASVLYQAPAGRGQARVVGGEVRALLGLAHGNDSWWSRVLPEDLPAARARYEAMLEGTGQMDARYRVRLPGGQVRDLRDRARVVQAQGQALLVGLLEDVTEAAVPAGAVMEKYRTLFDSIDSGFAIVEMEFDKAGHPSDYRFVEVNAAFERNTGIRKPVGRFMREIAPAHEDFWFQMYGRVALTGEPVRFEHAAEKLGFHYDVFAFRVGEPSLRQVGVLFTDITRRKKMEDGLKDQDRRKTEFIAMLAHELRNPLATISSGLDVLKLSGTGTPVLPMIERQLQQMTSLLDDLLDINRITLGKLVLRLETLDLDQVVRDTVEAFQPHYVQSGRVLSCTLAGQPLHVQADATRITQVLGNLLNNAAKFTDAGGRVEVEVSREGDEAVVRVRDDGIGIEPRQLGHIFELFAQVDSARQASFGGLGVGIALARELVEMHGGRIHADSRGLGQGAEFTVRLPLMAQAAPEDVPAGEQPRGQASLRVLVIDDNHDAADSIAMVIGLLGHEVTTCYSGSEGLASAREHPPQVVFTDIGMPGMDGHEVCRQLRAQPQGAAMHIVALTGWGAEEDRQRTREAGFDAHLVKPVTAALLTEALARLH